MERKPENQKPKLPPSEKGSPLKKIALIAIFSEEVKLIKKKMEMEELFQTLGYQIKPLPFEINRGNKKTFLDHLKKVADDLMPDTEAFVMVTICSTKNGQLQSPSSFSFDMEEFYMKFNGTNCPSMIGKPKIFIFHTYPYVEPISSKHPSAGRMPLKPVEKTCNLTIPLEADLLVIWSFEGYVGPSEPSPALIPSNSPKLSFLDVLDEVMREDFVKEGDHKNILELIVSVSFKLLEINKNEPIPITLSTLRRPFYLRYPSK